MASSIYRSKTGFPKIVSGKKVPEITNAFTPGTCDPVCHTTIWSFVSFTSYWGLGIGGHGVGRLVDSKF